MAKNRNRPQQTIKKEPIVDNQNTEQKNEIVTPVDENVQSNPETVVVTLPADQAAALLQPAGEGSGEDAEKDPGDAEEQPASAPKVDVRELYNQAAAELKVQEPVVIPAGQVQPTPVLNDVNQLPLSCSPASQVVIQELKDYIEKMSSRVRISADAGGQLQMNLYHTLVQAINSKAEDFDAVFGLVMKLIRDNLKGAFSDENLHRYTPHVGMPSQRVAHFRHLLSALTALASPETRNLALRHNAIAAFERPPVREDARQRVLNYFNV